MMPQSLLPSNPVDLLWYAVASIIVAVTAALLVAEIQKRPKQLRRVGRFVGVLLVFLASGLFFPALSLLPLDLALGLVVGVLIVVVPLASWVITKDP